MFARTGVVVCVLAALSLSFVGCGRTVTKARVGLLFKEKKYQEAVDILTPHLKRDSSDVDGFLFRGTAYCRLERFEEGLADFDKALELKPGDNAALKSRAKCLLDLQKYQEAAEAYDRVIEQNPDDAVYYFFRSIAYGKLERFEEALTDLDKTLSLEPEHNQARIDRAMCLLGLRRYQEAVEAYDHLIEETPDLAPFYLNRARSYEALGKYDLAIADAEESLRLDSRNGFAHFLLARILSICPVDELRDPERAIHEAEAIISMTSPGSEVHGIALGFIAAAHSQLGEFEKAIAVQEEGLGYINSPRDKEEAQKALEGYRNGTPHPPKKQSADDPPSEQSESANSPQ